MPAEPIVASRVSLKIESKEADWMPVSPPIQENFSHSFV